MQGETQDQKQPTVKELLQTVKPGEHRETVPLANTTLEDRGPVLPVGVVGEGVVLRDFTMKPSTMDLEVTIGRLRKDREFKNHPGKLVVAILAEVLESLCGIEFTPEVTPAQRRQAVIGLPYQDVAYLALYRAKERRVYEGRPIILGDSLTCTECGLGTNEIHLDLPRTKLATLEYGVENQPRSVVHLSQEVKLGEGMVTEYLVLGPGSWGRTVHGLTKDELDNEELMDLALGTGSILAGPDGSEMGPWRNQPRVLYQSNLMSWDGRLISDASRMVGGLILPFAPYQCKGCKADQYLPLGLRDLDVGFI